jgi:hypothetical protein
VARTIESGASLIIHPEASFVGGSDTLQIVTVIIVVRLAICRPKPSKHASDYFLTCVFLYFSQFGDSLVLEKWGLRLGWFVWCCIFLWNRCTILLCSAGEFSNHHFVGFRQALFFDADNFIVALI